MERRKRKKQADVIPKINFLREVNIIPGDLLAKLYYDQDPDKEIMARVIVPVGKINAPNKTLYDREIELDDSMININSNILEPLQKLEEYYVTEKYPLGFILNKQRAKSITRNSNNKYKFSSEDIEMKNFEDWTFKNGEYEGHFLSVGLMYNNYRLVNKYPDVPENELLRFLIAFQDFFHPFYNQKTIKHTIKIRDSEENSNVISIKNENNKTDLLRAIVNPEQRLDIILKEISERERVKTHMERMNESNFTSYYR